VAPPSSFPAVVVQLQESYSPGLANPPRNAAISCSGITSVHRPIFGVILTGGPGRRVPITCANSQGTARIPEPNDHYTIIATGVDGATLRINA